jgi:uncharacterized protein (TIGR00730 family)
MMTLDVSSICVFCGSKFGKNPAYRKAARDFGRLLATRSVRLVYGGGRIGLMGDVAEAVLDGGGEITGVVPEFLMEYEIGDPGGGELIIVDSMHQRKREMFERSDAFVVLPGGLGTIDEAIEVVTWKQLQIHAKPLVLVNVAGYWDPFLAAIDHVVDEDFGHPAIRGLFSCVSQIEDVFDAIQSSPPPQREVLTSHL